MCIRDRALPVLYEDDHVLIFHKPAGLLSQKSKPEDLSVAEYVIYYMLQTGSLKKEELATFKPSICNRDVYKRQVLTLLPLSVYGTISKSL